MATYVIGDVHNSLKDLEIVLEKISPSSEDQLYFLGDLFDRGGIEPNPVGVYFKILGLYSNVIWIRGNHDQLLSDYIYKYYKSSKKEQRSMQPYRYNSFDLIKDRLVEVDIINLADYIMNLPLQVELQVGSVKYLLAHAMTFDPALGSQELRAYLEGIGSDQTYWNNGVTGYISLVGHNSSSYQRGNPKGRFLDDGFDSIWRNDAGNLYMMDCGCGLPGGKLACMCLETGER